MCVRVLVRVKPELPEFVSNTVRLWPHNDVWLIDATSPIMTAIDQFSKNLQAVTEHCEALSFLNNRLHSAII